MVHRGFKSTGGIPNTAVDILEKKYLIRKGERSGAQWYELTHDRFIKPILDSNERWENKRQKEREKASAKLWQNALANLQSDQVLREKKVEPAVHLDWWNELRNLQFLEKLRRQDCIPFIGSAACEAWIPEANTIAYQWAQKYDYPFQHAVPAEQTNVSWTWLPDQLSQVSFYRQTDRR